MEFTTEIGGMEFGVSGDNGGRRNKRGAFGMASLHPSGIFEAVPKDKLAQQSRSPTHLLQDPAA